MKRPMLALLGAAMLVSMLPAAASADPVTKYDEHRVSLSCDRDIDGGHASVFLDSSSAFGTILEVDVWLDPAVPFEEPATMTGSTDTVDVVEGADSFTVSATVSLTGPNGESTGDGTVDVAMTATDAPTPVVPFTGNNHHSATSGTVQHFAGEATLHLPGLDATVGDCTGDVTDMHVFEANPTAFVLKPSGVAIDCFWASEDATAGFVAQQDAGGFFADAFESTKDVDLFSTGSSGSFSLTSLSAHLDLVDGPTGDAYSASADASFELLGTPVVSTLLSSARREKITEQALTPTGSIAFSTGDSFPLDLEHCVARQFSSHVNISGPVGPKAGGKPPVNDVPDGALALDPGDRFNVQTKGTSPAAEVPIETCPQGFFDNMGRTLWYTVAGTGGQMTIDTAGSDIDTLIGLYTRDGDAFTEVGCIDDVSSLPVGTTFQAALTFDTVQGETYYAQIGGYLSPFSDAAEFGRLRVALR